MSALLELVVLAFATVGLIALARWIFRSGWGTPWKVVGLLATVSLWWAMCNGPLGGRWGADHGALTDLIATFGIVIAGTWGFRRVGNDWRRQAAVVVGALALLLVMWVPRYNAGELTMPSTSRAAPSVAPSTAAPTTPVPGAVPCDELTYELRQEHGCP